MKLPRDLSGVELAALLNSYGYDIVRQTGSHIRLTSTLMGREHHVTVPRHSALRVGTLAAILADIAEYLEVRQDDLRTELFG